MRVTIDDYGFVYVRLAVIKSLLMSVEDQKKLLSFSELDSLGSYVKRFFPNFAPEEVSVREYEWALWNTYFSIIEKILIAAPEAIQLFLKALLIKYEILNLKICIYGAIENTTYEDRYYRVFNKPSILLDRYDLLKELLSMKTLDELDEILENTPYRRIVLDGIAKYDETGEIFYLEHDLDKYYYSNLLGKAGLFKSEEKQLIQRYVGTEIDYYSLNLIYRTLFNNLPIESITPYIIMNGYAFQSRDMQNLLRCSTLDEFYIALEKILRTKKGYIQIIEKIKVYEAESWEWIQDFLLEKFFSKNKSSTLTEISLSSISLIFTLLINKKKEIRKIIARTVQISLAEEKM